MLGATPSPANDISVGQCFEVNKCRDSIESDQDVNECCRGDTDVKRSYPLCNVQFQECRNDAKDVNFLEFFGIEAGQVSSICENPVTDTALVQLDRSELSHDVEVSNTDDTFHEVEKSVDIFREVSSVTMDNTADTFHEVENVHDTFRKVSSVNMSSHDDFRVPGDRAEHLCDSTIQEKVELCKILRSNDLFCAPVGTFPKSFLYPAKCESSQSIEASASRGADILTTSRVDIQAILDSGASMTSIGNRDEFKTLNESINKVVMKGIASGLQIEGTGIVEYHLLGDNEELIRLELEAYYVPALPKDLRLLSPQHLKTVEGHRASVVCHSGDNSGPGFAELLIRKDEAGWQTMPPMIKKTINYHPRSNLPILVLTMPKSRAKYERELISALCVTDASNQNLTNAQKELLKWHFRLGHVGFRHIQWLVRVGRLKVANSKGVSTCVIPKCAACEFGKASRRPTKADVTQSIPEKEMELKKNDLLPGQRVSVDHYQSSQTGRLYTSRGGTSSDDMFHGGAIFVDHASGFVVLRHQVSLSATDTIRSKMEYERIADSAGVVIQQYHTDNGVFTSKDFMDEILKSGQNVRFSGVGTGHQNGVAERGIKTVVNMARTMLLHAAIHGPDGFVTTQLWPMAMDYAAWLYNHIPKMDSGVAPVELWSRTAQSTVMLLDDCHVWGCPVYVLEPKLQKSGVKIPKWNPRSRRGVNMGFSDRHASTIALVLNLMTKSISPQFHVVFDDWFTSVHSNGEELDPEVWNSLITNPSCRLKAMLDDDEDVDLTEEWLSEDERIEREARRRNTIGLQRERLLAETEATIERENVRTQIVPTAASEHVERTAIPTRDEVKTVRFSNTRRAIVEDPTRIVRKKPLVVQDSVEQIISPEVAIPVPPENTVAVPVRKSGFAVPVTEPGSGVGVLRRSSRLSRQPMNYDPGVEAASKWKDKEVVMMAETMAGAKCSKSEYDALIALLEEQDAANIADVYTPMAFASKKKEDPDTPSYVEALSGDHAEQYWIAMRDEIDALVKRKTWEVVLRSKCEPDAVIVPGTWAFRCKRRPDGTFRKFKARWCVRGDLERRINGQRGEQLDTYSPVVQWSSVRLMLVLTVTMGMVTRAVDFSNAFAQADMPEGLNVYLEMPENFESCDGTDSVLRLKKSLYGQLIAPRLWYEKLSTGLIARGFVKSTIDPCMFISKKVVVLAYVDDLIIYAMTEKPIDDLLESFKNDGDEYNWEMTVEGSVNEFLGIDITRMGNKWKLTQKGLIQNVLKATGMVDCNAKESPTNSDGKPLGSDKLGEPAKESWSYSSVVGMLLYLASNSRPDISFAVHQCARFTHNPKVSHEKAIIRICRYLKGTQEEGLIYEPSSEMTVDCYVDADFAGLYGVEDSQDPISVKSRTGYVILIANCPLLWVSKLQSEIALSTLESEFIALSSSFRSLIPTKRLIEETLKGLNITSMVKYSAKSTVFEDNNGALQLATTKKLTPRTRHIATKYFWFLEQVDKGLATIVKVESSQNKSDIFTKNLKPHDFINARKLLCGW